MRILIAEDDNITRKSLERKLPKWGYEVVSTTDGDEAWKKLQSADAPKLVIPPLTKKKNRSIKNRECL